MNKNVYKELKLSFPHAKEKELRGIYIKYVNRILAEYKKIDFRLDFEDIEKQLKQTYKEISLSHDSIESLINDSSYITNKVYSDILSSVIVSKSQIVANYIKDKSYIDYISKVTPEDILNYQPIKAGVLRDVEDLIPSINKYIYDNLKDQHKLYTNKIKKIEKSISKSDLNKLSKLEKKLKKTQYEQTKIIDEVKRKAKRKAELKARNEIGNIYSQSIKSISKEQKVDLFRFVTANDGKVRDTHIVYHNVVFKFSVAPIIPGEEWGCRCEAMLIIAINKNQIQQDYKIYKENNTSGDRRVAINAKNKN